MNRIVKDWLFSRSITTITITLFISLNIVSFSIELFVGKIGFFSEVAFRALSIICDVIIVSIGLVKWSQIRWRKSITKTIGIKPNRIQMFWIGILADAITGFAFIYSLYFLRLFIFYSLDKISFESLKINAILGLITALAYGFMDYIIRKLKAKSRKNRNLRKTTPGSGGSFL